ncbi:MAG: Smr/MutS family protein [Chlorobi bacterium]|nr:Smr/MutS family protein [Chlorobiota bacterium]
MKYRLRPGIRCFHRRKDFSGIVRRVEGDSVWVEDEFGFTERFDAADCLADEMDLTRRVGAYVPWQKGDKQKPKAAKRSPELDLHIEKLNPHMRNAPAHEILTYQLREARRFIRLMKRQNRRPFKIITGEGSGKLRREVIRLLREEGFRDFRDDRYGGGALTVG